MKPDDNWRETRLLAEDLDTLLDLPVNTTEEFLKIMENLIIHRYVEAISNEDFKGKDCQIELPYIGSLIVSTDDKGHLSTDFVVRKAFNRKLRNAYYNRESPLINQCAKILGQDLVEKFEEDGGKF